MSRNVKEKEKLKKAIKGLKIIKKLVFQCLFVLFCNVRKKEESFARILNDASV